MHAPESGWEHRSQAGGIWDLPPYSHDVIEAEEGTCGFVMGNVKILSVNSEGGYAI